MKDNPYNTLDKNEFAKSLASMSVVDLSHLCNEVGVNAPPFIGKMRKALMASFESYVKKNRKPVKKRVEPIVDKSSPETNSVVSLFEEE